MIAQLDRTYLRAAPGRAASRLLGYSLFEGRPLTTRGRQWNTFVFAHLRLAARGGDQRVDRPIFIVGMGRSGTTLLGRILAMHPVVGFLNEPKAMWHVIRDDEDIIGSYAPPHTGRLYLDAEAADDGVKRRGHALFAWYLRASHSTRVVDKYPELIFRHRFVRAIFPDARFMIAVRSPWATLASVATWSQSHASGTADWWGLHDQKWDILWTQGVVGRAANADLVPLALASERDHHVRAAVEWLVSMREAVALAAADPLARLVHYDELVRHPRRLTHDVLRFCELPESTRTEEYAETIVSPPARYVAHDTPSLRLPDALVEALNKTWAQLAVTHHAP